MKVITPVLTVFLLILFLSFLILAGLFFLLPKVEYGYISLKSDYTKYKKPLSGQVTYISRKWMEYAMHITKKENLSQQGAARFYAYVSSVFSDTLNQTGDINESNTATYMLVILLAPKDKEETDNFFSSLQNVSKSLNPQAQLIYDRYKTRIESDGYSLTLQNIPKGENNWYPRGNKVDKDESAGNWLPWVINADMQFDIPPPPKKGSIQDLLEIERFKYALLVRQPSDLDEVYFWHGSSGSLKRQTKDDLPLADIWQNILYVESGDSIDEANFAKNQKLLAQSIADSFIVTWRAKYKFLAQRPSMRIPNLDLVVTDPPFPGYVSEHAAVSYTAATVLSALIPDKKNTWFEDAVDAKNSGLLAGTNFSIDNRQGAILGNLVGQNIVKKIDLNKIVPSTDTFSSNSIFDLIEFLALRIYDWIFTQKNYLKSQFELKRIVSVLKNCNSNNNRGVFEEISEKADVFFDDAWVKKYQNTFIGTNSPAITDDVVVDDMSGGVVAADFNNDGKIDLFFISHDKNYLFLNSGDLKFKDVTSESGIFPFKNAMGAIAADYDNDGFKDLLIYGFKSPPRLYRNLGNMHFQDVTHEVGLDKIDLFGMGATFGDYDRDGWLDLYLISYSQAPFGDDVKIYPNVLFRNNHGRFEDVTSKAGVNDSGAGLAVTFTDFNNDNWPDLIIANDFGPNTFFQNNKNGTFTKLSDTQIRYNTRNDNNGMGIAVADYNSDGWPDVYITSVYEDKNLLDPGGNELFINMRNKGFNNMARHAGVDIGGWGWGVVPIDYNNDSLVDIAEVGGFSSAFYTSSMEDVITKNMVSPKSFLYKNQGNLHFKETSCEENFKINGEGRGLAVADLDNDGYPDLVVNESRRKPLIYHNKGGKNHWLKIQLQGSKSNKDAIGAKVWVINSKTQVKELQSSGSFLSGSEPDFLFGLGSDEKIKQVKILWPSGEEQIFENVHTDQTLKIQE